MLVSPHRTLCTKWRVTAQNLQLLDNMLVPSKYLVRILLFVTEFHIEKEFTFYIFSFVVQEEIIFSMCYTKMLTSPHSQNHYWRKWFVNRFFIWLILSLVLLSQSCFLHNLIKAYHIYLRRTCIIILYLCYKSAMTLSLFC